MSLFDITLIIIIGSFGLFGLWFGLVHTLGSLIGMILGVFLATRYYETMANWLMNITGWQANFSKVLIFIIAFFLINRLVGLIFWIIDKLLGFITRLPFINGINRFLGLLFGLLEGAIGLGMVFYFIGKFPLSEWFMGKLGESFLMPSLVNMANILTPFIPEALKAVQSSIDYFIK
ncbi:MAG TPA: CvpA family protein [Candidatus Magasanikbacteria bacterium]|nr:CvpA family protein [Candidatus Magasanikbacteria bacterium]